MTKIKWYIYILFGDNSTTGQLSGMTHSNWKIPHPDYKIVVSSNGDADKIWFFIENQVPGHHRNPGSSWHSFNTPRLGYLYVPLN